ncbi:RNA polymerase factor sigma-54 [uncultured Allofournierella sp.]|uniref:RNA polymerase factor sigma-54 n=1 Tax=uncultured Allofournierella sp. TaxID=1940258 RepID=UPI0025F88854|nr:RNA polymerase factor sigma-54 [uncultured Fournierella sp.]
MELIQQQEQRQVLSQGLRHSLEILQMPVLELQEFLQEKALENPLLELELPQEMHLPDPAESTAEERGGEADRWEATGSESAAVWDLPAGEGLGEWNRGGDGEWDRMAALADPADRGESLAEALHEQLLRMPGLTDELRRLADYLAECLNENGFLEFSLEDLAADRGVSVFEMEQALYVLQSLQPAGVAARTLPECLVLQLAQTKDFNEYTVRLVRQGLELLAKNNMTAIARLLECTPAQAQAAARAVRALNPRPAQGYGAGPLAYQIPEAVFRRENGQVVIELERRLAPRLQLNEQNCTLLQQSGTPEAKTYLKERRAEAQQLMRAVAERESTLVRLLRQLARDQQDFFLQGGPLKPMTLTQMAQSLGLSLSTVSRAVQGKILQFEGRSLPLKRFFSAGVPVEGGQVSSESIKRQLQRFVQAEDPAKPLSDEALRAALEAVNLPVARRTVAKYREELGIPSSSARRRVE